MLHPNDDGHKLYADYIKTCLDENYGNYIKKYTDIDCLDRETVQKLIDYICVGKRLEGSRDIPIEIHWNF